MGSASQHGEYRATITLITGDKVRYIESPDGRATASIIGDIRPAPGTRSYSDATGFYVVPGQAEPYVASGALDRELFDVKYLAHNGYGDAETATLPVIVSYEPHVSRQAIPTTAGKLAAVTRLRALTSIRAESVAVDKHHAAQF